MFIVKNELANVKLCAILRSEIKPHCKKQHGKEEENVIDRRTSVKIL